MDGKTSVTVAEEESARNAKARILAVDDDRTLLMLLETRLESQGYEVVTARSGEEACEILDREKDGIDAILLDRQMPGMKGLDVVERLKKDSVLKRIPIIMQTGADKPEEIKEGIDAGVYYYLTKPIDDNLLQSVLSAALREVEQRKTLRSEMNSHRISFGHITACEFEVTTLSDAENLACFAANCFPEPDHAVSGLAELLVNAVEHGNLGIGYADKTELIASATWREEVLRRQALPENEDKLVTMSLTREERRITVVIVDQGDGFEWRRFMKIDPSRASHNHGRGIAQANLLSFDTLDYNEKGTEVTATVDLEKPLDW